MGNYSHLDFDIQHQENVLRLNILKTEFEAETIED